MQDEETVNSRQVFDAYNFAIATKSKGDNLGRKMIFLVLVRQKTIMIMFIPFMQELLQSLGAGADNYWMNINGSDEDKALGELIDSCSNNRIYITYQLK